MSKLSVVVLLLLAVTVGGCVEEEPIVYDMNDELQDLFEKAIKENANTSSNLFETKNKVIGYNNFFVVGVIEKDGVKCLEEEAFSSEPVYSITFVDGKVWMVNNEPFKYDTNSPTGLYIYKSVVFETFKIKKIIT
ncbi:MAG: hypothetical protein KAQ64_01965 [Candidatus Pacebacteria bacterium]|nr:hypothetical protein [Candidatus Paceibacterota bacterium]